MYSRERIFVMRDYDDLPTIVIERRSAGFGAFFWGALIGAGAALLLAPRSGEEMQEQIRRRVRRARDAAENRVDRVTGAVTRTRARVQDTVDRVHGTVDTVRDRFEAGTERARETYESGRRVAREAREEIESRLADARDSFDALSDEVAVGDDPFRRADGVDIVVTDVGEEPGVDEGLG
jgi:gas vesicle protein